MSSVMDTVAGKGRNIGVNTWLTVLGVSVLVFAANTGYATWKAGQLSGASGAASDLQVLSQTLAAQGQQAVGGDAKAFEQFRSAKTQIDANIQRLNSNFGNTAGVSGPIAGGRSATS